MCVYRVVFQQEEGNLVRAAVGGEHSALDRSIYARDSSSISSFESWQGVGQKMNLSQFDEDAVVSVLQPAKLISRMFFMVYGGEQQQSACTAGRCSQH
mmetsp:Transcript_11920/g.19746  ORF Transcript_11920/g.19746 Transcript_11920/m.19746 type:complete len:98 (-) Transcript_11920:194-487(-)